MDVIISYVSLDDLKRVYASDPSRLQFINYVQNFLQTRNIKNSHHSGAAPIIPVINGKYLDLFELYNAVNLLGGFEIVNKDQKWGTVAAKLGFPSPESVSLVMTSYNSLLLAFEQSHRQASKIPSTTNPSISLQPIIPQGHIPSSSYLPKPQPLSIPQPLPQYQQQLQPQQPPHHQPQQNYSLPPKSIIQQGTSGMNVSTSHPSTLHIPPAVSISTHIPNQSATSALTANLTNKRSRPSETINHASTYSAEIFTERLNGAIRDLNSKDPTVIVKSLNYLLQKSCELIDSQAIQLENCPHLLISLGALLDVINPLAKCLFPETALSDFLLNEKDYWGIHLPSHGNIEYQRLALSIEESSMLFPILSILRNLSMEYNNELILASSLCIMRHVVSIVYTGVLSSLNFGESMNFAMDILINLGGKIDITGRRKLYSHSWMDDNSDTSNKRFLLRSSITETSLDDSRRRYQYIMLSLLALLIKYLNNNENRALLLKSLETISKLAQSNDNTIIFNRCPDIFLSSLVNLLCVSYSQIDPLIFGNDLSSNTPGSNLSTTRPPGNVGSYYYIDLNDFEVREATLETLSMLITSRVLQIRLAQVPYCVKILMKICDTTRSKYRSDSQIRAHYILSLMIQHPENIKKFQTIHIDMMMQATTDDLIGELLSSCTPAIYHDQNSTQPSSTASYSANTLPF